MLQEFIHLLYEQQFTAGYYANIEKLNNKKPTLVFFLAPTKPL
jgi:hypothetical protein